MDASSTHNSSYDNPEFVDRYTKTNSKKLFMKKYLDRFEKEVRNRGGTKVLDLGCGPGQDSWYLASRGLIVTAIDLSEEMIKRARKLKRSNNAPKFIVADVNNIDKLFGNNSFDAIWFNAVLVHFNKKDTRNILMKLKKILTEHGIVFMSLKEGTKNRAVPIVSDNTGLAFYFWTRGKFEKLLKTCSYKILDFSLNKTNKAVWLNYIVLC